MTFKKTIWLSAAAVLAAAGYWGFAVSTKAATATIHFDGELGALTGTRQLVFDVSGLDNWFQQVIVRLNVKNDECRGNGSNNCDQIKISVLNKQDQFTIENTEYDWQSVTLKLKSEKPTNGLLTVELEPIVRGGGEDKTDILRIADIYIDVTHYFKEKGEKPDDLSRDIATDYSGEIENGAPSEKDGLDDPPHNSATDRRGKKPADPPQEKNDRPDDPTKGGAVGHRGD